MTKLNGDFLFLKNQIELVEMLNDRYDIGDKIRVQLDDGSIVIWTVSNTATILGGNTAVIWCKEHRGCYAAGRVQSERSCKKCGCIDSDCSQCIEAQGYPCSWVDDYLCSRCKAEQEAARKA